MDFIFGLFGIAVGIYVLIYIVAGIAGIFGFIGSFFLSTSSSTVSSGSRSSSNYGQGQRRTSANMGQFEIRARIETRGDNSDLRIISVEGRGLLPVYRNMEIDFVTWAEDVTDDSDGEPIICSLTEFQHPDNTPVFQCVRAGGSLSPNQGFSNWVEIGIAPLDALTFPKSGTRNIKIYTYMTEKTSPKLRKAIAGDTFNIQIINSETGYKEWTAKRIDALVLTMRLGVALAHIDGEFKDSEASTVKKWFKDRVERLNDDEQESAKLKLNEELKKAVVLARSGKLDHSSACIELKGNSTKNASYDALELCTMIMASDGVIDKRELDLLKKIANLLDIPSTDIQSLKDKHAANASVVTSNSREHSDEMLIDIDTSLSPAQVRRKLLADFNRYNDLLTIERNSVKRKRYQECIDAIARLLKKYG